MIGYQWKQKDKIAGYSWIRSQIYMDTDYYMIGYKWIQRIKSDKKSDILGYNRNRYRISSKGILSYLILVSCHIQESTPYVRISWDQSG